MKEKIFKIFSLKPSIFRKALMMVLYCLLRPVTKYSLCTCCMPNMALDNVLTMNKQDGPMSAFTKVTFLALLVLCEFSTSFCLTLRQTK